MNEQQMNSAEWLDARSTIVEQPFASHVPLIGPLIVWIRTQWNNIAARWYVQPLIAQQNTFNRLLVERVREVETYNYELLVAQDREMVRLQRDIAALHQRLTQLTHELQAVNDRIAQIEAMQRSEG